MLILALGILTSLRTWPMETSWSKSSRIHAPGDFQVSMVQTEESALRIPLGEAGSYSELDSSPVCLCWKLQILAYWQLLTITASSRVNSYSDRTNLFSLYMCLP